MDLAAHGQRARFFWVNKKRAPLERRPDELG